MSLLWIIGSVMGLRWFVNHFGVRLILPERPCFVLRVPDLLRDNRFRRGLVNLLRSRFTLVFRIPLGISSLLLCLSLTCLVARR